jgi:hypothetical protein
MACVTVSMLYHYNDNGSFCYETLVKVGNYDTIIWNTRSEWMTCISTCHTVQHCENTVTQLLNFSSKHTFSLSLSHFYIFVQDMRQCNRDIVISSVQFPRIY